MPCSWTLLSKNACFTEYLVYNIIYRVFLYHFSTTQKYCEVIYTATQHKKTVCSGKEDHNIKRNTKGVMSIGHWAGYYAGWKGKLLYRVVICCDLGLQKGRIVYSWLIVTHSLMAYSYSFLYMAYSYSFSSCHTPGLMVGLKCRMALGWHQTAGHITSPSSRTDVPSLNWLHLPGKTATQNLKTIPDIFS